MARELGYRFGQAHATTCLAIAARYAGDLDDAARLARQAGQIPPTFPGTAARACGSLLAGVLAEAGDLAGAEQACAATLARARDAGDMHSLDELLPVLADLDLRADRTGDGAAHLREAAQIGLRTGTWSTILNVLYPCGYLCAATGAPADAITAWAADEPLGPQGGLAWYDAEASRREDALGQVQARRSARRGPARPNSAARR